MYRIARNFIARDVENRIFPYRKAPESTVKNLKRRQPPTLQPQDSRTSRGQVKVMGH
jgi:hypothetical protein